MAEERGDSRFSSFLVGFLIGSLLAGGTATGYFVWQERHLAREAAMREAMALEQRAHAMRSQHEAEASRKLAEAWRDRAEEALKKLKEN
jgi:hypothetical protein